MYCAAQKLKGLFFLTIDFLKNSYRYLLLGGLLIFLVLALQNHLLYVINNIFVFNRSISMNVKANTLIALLLNGLFFVCVYWFNKLAAKWKEGVYFSVVFGIGFAAILIFAFALTPHYMWDYIRYRSCTLEMLSRGVDVTLTEAGLRDPYKVIFLRRMLVYIYPFYKLFGDSANVLRIVNAVLSAWTIANFYFICRMTFQNKYIPRFVLIMLFGIWNHQYMASSMHNIPGLFYLSCYLVCQVWLYRIAIGKGRLLWLPIPVVVICASLYLYELARNGSVFLSFATLLTSGLFVLKTVQTMEWKKKEIFRINRDALKFSAILLICGFLLPLLSYSVIEKINYKCHAHRAKAGDIAFLYVFSEYEANKQPFYQHRNIHTIMRFTLEQQKNMSLGGFSSSIYYYPDSFRERTYGKLSNLADFYGINFLQRSGSKSSLAKFWLKNQDTVKYSGMFFALFGVLGCLFWTIRRIRIGYGLYILMSFAVLLGFAQCISSEIYVYYNFGFIPLAGICCAIFFGCLAEPPAKRNSTESKKSTKFHFLALLTAVLTIVSGLFILPEVIGMIPGFRKLLFVTVSKPDVAQVTDESGKVSPMKISETERKYVFSADGSAPKKSKREYDIKWVFKRNDGKYLMNMAIYCDSSKYGLPAKKVKLSFAVNGVQLPHPQGVNTGYIFNGLPVEAKNGRIEFEMKCLAEKDSDLETIILRDLQVLQKK